MHGVCAGWMIIDDNDNIYISYQVRDQSKLKVATNKSGSWDVYTADSGASTSSLHPGYMTSMVMWFLRIKCSLDMVMGLHGLLIDYAL